jgi:hypothetical protein
MRRILHIQVGNDDWEPSQEELELIGKLFNDALDTEDPTSLILTRTGVKIIGVTDIDETKQIIEGVLVTRPLFNLDDITNSLEEFKKHHPSELRITINPNRFTDKTKLCNYFDPYIEENWEADFVKDGFKGTLFSCKLYRDSTIPRFRIELDANAWFFCS